MRRLLLLLALGAAAPALAQHDGHPGSAAPARDPHAGHVTPAPPPPAADPRAGHEIAGEAPADPHAGRDEPIALPSTAPPPPAAADGPVHAADQVYGADEMARARATMRGEHGGLSASKLMLDRLEWRAQDGRDGYAWKGEAWHGGDIDKIWLKSEGEGAFGQAPQRAEVQALWSHAIDPWFDLQIGLRHDFRPDPERTHIVLGIEGLAPYWFELGAAAFLSDKGEISTRVEAEYDLRLTQRLILQPAAELDFALQDVPEIGAGSGLVTAELGARLRYEIEREFAPYLGLHYERAFGDTARHRRAAGEEAGGWSLLLGIRAWF
jgi:copper resistance protein B